MRGEGHELLKHALIQRGVNRVARKEEELIKCIEDKILKHKPQDCMSFSNRAGTRARNLRPHND